MVNNNNKTLGPGEVQVFELTMDNEEDQEELNLKLRKPGEPGYCPPAALKTAGAFQLDRSQDGPASDSHNG